MWIAKTIAVSLALLFIALAPAPSRAATYSYVGSWLVSDGPLWYLPDNYGAPVYSGQEAAALLFGGSPSDYAISTNGSNPANINFSAWLDGWGDQTTYGSGGVPGAQNFKLDLGGLGYNSACFLSNNCFYSAYSAYVLDHQLDLRNYAFRVTETPLPGALVLFGSVLGLFSLGRARREFSHRIARLFRRQAAEARA